MALREELSTLEKAAVIWYFALEIGRGVVRDRPGRTRLYMQYGMAMFSCAQSHITSTRESMATFDHFEGASECESAFMNFGHEPGSLKRMARFISRTPK